MVGGEFVDVKGFEVVDIQAGIFPVLIEAVVVLRLVVDGVATSLFLPTRLGEVQQPRSHLVHQIGGARKHLPRDERIRNRLQPDGGGGVAMGIIRLRSFNVEHPAALDTQGGFP